MSTGLAYGGVRHSDAGPDRERLLAGGMANQINNTDNTRHSLRGKPRKIWVL